jgi:hypothetical protein
VAEQHRLRALEVRVEGQDGVAVAPREDDERALHGADAGREDLARLHEVQAQVRRHLVVAAARGVQALAVLADELREAALHRHVDVLVGRERLEGVLVELERDALQALHDALDRGRRQDAGLPEHLRVRDGADDVLGPQAPVHGERAVDAVQRRVHAAGEAAAEEAVGGGLARLA